MAGQPLGQFDVTGIQVVETEGPATTPSLIVDQGKTFTVAASFEGTGGDWENLIVNAGIYEYRVRYYIDDLTGTFPEELLRATPWTPLVANTFSYSGTSVAPTAMTVAGGTRAGGGDIPEGVYKLIAIVDFRNGIGVGNPPLPQWVGYSEEMLLVTPVAEVGN